MITVTVRARGRGRGRRCAAAAGNDYEACACSLLSGKTYGKMIHSLNLPYSTSLHIQKKKKKYFFLVNLASRNSYM
eukprot:SAG11_NODE_184_length_13162_cov_9.151803_9_plen_76_part_00